MELIVSVVPLLIGVQIKAARDAAAGTSHAKNASTKLSLRTVMMWPPQS